MGTISYTAERECRPRPSNRINDDRMLTRSHKRSGPAGSRDLVSGNCMTCSSPMAWPRGIANFKCKICATINDLNPLHSHQPKENAGSSQGPRQDGKPLPPVPQPSSRPHQPAASARPLSLEHTKRLVRQCQYAYLTRRLCKGPGAEDENKPATQPGIVPAPYTKIERRATDDPASYTPKYTFNEEPTLRRDSAAPSRPPLRAHTNSLSVMPNAQGSTLAEPSQDPRGHVRQVSGSREIDSSRIFRPLEDYLLDCFSSFERVNSSFTVPTPHHHSKSSLDPVKRKPVPSARDKQPPPPYSREKPLPQLPPTELDPKLLMLGDVAENGTWWLGEEGNSPPKQPTMGRHGAAYSPSSFKRSPLMNWSELTLWYSSVTNTAEGWFAIYEELSRRADFTHPTERELRRIEQDLLQSQEHVKRALLKVTENLLKRPGGHITQVADCRFLLIVLENPLLYSDSTFFRGIMSEGVDLSRTGTLGQHSTVPSSGPLSGHHSGIVKRVMGLIANADDVHQQLIGWWSRHDSKRFTRSKELVFGFLTYRLLRQDEKKQKSRVDITAGLIPQLHAGRSGAALHDEIGSSRKQKPNEVTKANAYADDWQVRATARVLSLLFAANTLHPAHRRDDKSPSSGHVSTLSRGLFLPISDFYSSVADNVDLVTDFEDWEAKRSKFSFCQYPFLLSIWAKTQILEHDARRQMSSMARDAFFDSIMTRRTISQYLALDVRRDCLVEDSLKAVSEVVGSGSNDVKKALRITFRGEEGIDAGGLRKEWFLLLVREVFNPEHGMFVYDEDSQYGYFNPHSFETSDQFFLVGVVLGLAIYNLTILDVALPPFMFRKLLASAPAFGAGGAYAQLRQPMRYTLDDLAEYRPRLAQGLRTLLEYDGDVESTFYVNFVIDTQRYDKIIQVPLCEGGERRPVTNENRREYVDLYVRYLLDTAVVRQFEPFKRGFYTICGGNAFYLFRPEEIELLIRGTDEPLDVGTLRGTAEYENWNCSRPDGQEPVVAWFWEAFEEASTKDQRKLLSFITGSDRLPATKASMMPIKLLCRDDDDHCIRYPSARTCFNHLLLSKYETKEKLKAKLWTAVYESEGFGLK